MAQAASDATAVPAEVLESAIIWAVRLGSGEVSAGDLSACETWRRLHPAHERAWQQIQSVDRDFRAAPALGSQLAIDTLQRLERERKRGKSRRDAIRLLGCGAVAVGVGGLVKQWLDNAAWLENTRIATAPGERRRVQLADGSELVINAASELEVRHGVLRRVIALHRGEVFVETGADPDAPLGRRPFWVETVDARFEAIGTRFGVRRIGGHGELADTVLHVVEGRVAVHAGDVQAPVMALPKDAWRVRAGTGGIERLASTGLEPDAWLDGMLVAKQMRLDAFAAELARYRRRPLRCDPAIAGMRVSGVFQLEGAEPVDRALQVLVRTLPVRRVVQADGGELLTPD